MNENTRLYTVRWQQSWPGWQQMQADSNEMQLQRSNMSEARMVLDYIMSL